MKALKIVTLLLLMSSYSAKSQIALSRQQAERVLQVADSLDVCREEVSALNKVIAESAAKDKAQAIAAANTLLQATKWQEAYNYQTTATAEWKATAITNEKMYNREKRKGWIWKLAVPAAAVLGFLSAK